MVSVPIAILFLSVLSFAATDDNGRINRPNEFSGSIYVRLLAAKVPNLAISTRSALIGKTIRRIDQHEKPDLCRKESGGLSLLSPYVADLHLDPTGTSQALDSYTKPSDEQPSSESRAISSTDFQELGQKTEKAKPSKRKRMRLRRQALQKLMVVDGQPSSQTKAVGSPDPQDIGRQERERNAAMFNDLQETLIEQSGPAASDHAALQNNYQDKISVLSSDNEASQQSIVSSNDEISKQPIISPDDNTQSTFCLLEEPSEQTVFLSTHNDIMEQSIPLQDVSVADSGASVLTTSPNQPKQFEFSASLQIDVVDKDQPEPLSHSISFFQRKTSFKNVKQDHRERRRAFRTSAFKHRTRSICPVSLSVADDTKYSKSDEQQMERLPPSALLPCVAGPPNSQISDDANSSFNFLKTLRFVADRESGLFLPESQLYSFSTDNSASDCVSAVGFASFKLLSPQSRKRCNCELAPKSPVYPGWRRRFRDADVVTRPTITGAAEGRESETKPKNLEQEFENETTLSTGKYGRSAEVTASSANQESPKKIVTAAMSEEPWVKAANSADKLGTNITVLEETLDTEVTTETAISAAGESIYDVTVEWPIDKAPEQEDVISSNFGRDQQLPAIVPAEGQDVLREAGRTDCDAIADNFNDGLRELGPPPKSLSLHAAGGQSRAIEKSMIIQPDVNEQSQLNVVSSIWSQMWFKAIILTIPSLIVILLIAFFLRRHIVRQRRLSVLDNNIVFVNYPKNGSINMESDQEDNLFSTASIMLQRGGIQINY